MAADRFRRGARFCAASLGLAALLVCGHADRARAQEPVVVGVRCDAPPFAYWQGAAASCGERGRGEFRGYVVELCRTLLRSIGRQFREVAITASSRFSALETGEADILCEPTTVNVARASEVHFSQIFFVSGVSYLYTTREPGQGNRGRIRVGVLSGTTAEATVERMVAENTFRVGRELVDLVHPETHQEGVDGICKGELDFYVGDRDIITSLAARIDGCEARASGKFFSYEPYAIAVAKRDPELAMDIQRALYVAFADGVPQRLFANHFPRKEPSGALKALWMLQAIPGGSRRRGPE